MNGMRRDGAKSVVALVASLVLSCLTVFLFFIWEGNVGLSLWDEGFLWYGVQRVVAGEVPIRDFFAYDPGRYYWTAALVGMMGDSGIMQVRAAAAVFQAIGLFTALLLIINSAKIRAHSWPFWGVAAVTLAVWMFPRHKLFDIALSILLIGALTFLIARPVASRFFAAGVAVGLAAVFGRNHGVYGMVASSGVFGWLSINSEVRANVARGFVYWAIGVVVGFLPIIIMALLVPGFGKEFWKSIEFLFEQGATNLPLPLPWPWNADFGNKPVGDAARDFLVGVFFIGVLAFGWLGLIWAVRARRQHRTVPPALAAAIFLAIPYSHYVLSRADVGHLALSVFPTLIGVFILLTTLDVKARWILSAGLCAASLWVMTIQHPGWQCAANGNCVDVVVSGSKLKVDAATAADVEFLRDVAKLYTPNGESFVAAPGWPGAYALLDRRSPMWEIYALVPRNGSFEREEVERIKTAAPRFVLIYDFALDGREELRFKNTHPLTYHYIVDNFDLVPLPSHPGYLLYKPRSANPNATLRGGAS